MSSLRVEQTEARAQDVKLTADSLTVGLTDGRTISVPIAWFPRLQHGSGAERKNWRLIAQGEGIHWTDLDEDISVEGLLHGQPSRESLASLEKWLQGRHTRIPTRRKTHNSRLQPPASSAKKSA